MKKKITRMLCLVLAMTTLLATGAMAASPTSVPWGPMGARPTKHTIAVHIAKAMSAPDAM